MNQKYLLFVVSDSNFTNTFNLFFNQNATKKLIIKHQMSTMFM